MNMMTYDAKHVAGMLGLNVHTLRMWCRRGYCDSGRSLGGGKLLFTTAQIQAISQMLEDGGGTGGRGMPRTRLTRRMVRAYLDTDKAQGLERIATGRNTDVPTLIAETLQPLLDAEEQGESLFTITLAADDVRKLRYTIERLCDGDDEPEPVNIEDEIPKWLDGYCRLGIERDAQSK